jgi:hypothetical protein
MGLSHTLILTALVVLAAVFACGCMSQETVVPDEEKAQALAYAEPIADNLLSGFNEGNYTTYSRDFSEGMKQAVDEAAFGSRTANSSPRGSGSTSRGTALS